MVVSLSVGLKAVVFRRRTAHICRTDEGGAGITGGAPSRGSKPKLTDRKFSIAVRALAVVQCLATIAS
jgi:hypothetical protein